MGLKWHCDSSFCSPTEQRDTLIDELLNKHTSTWHDISIQCNIIVSITKIHFNNKMIYLLPHNEPWDRGCWIIIFRDFKIHLVFACLVLRLYSSRLAFWIVWLWRYCLCECLLMRATCCFHLSRSRNMSYSIWVTIICSIPGILW